LKLSIPFACGSFSWSLDGWGDGAGRDRARGGAVKVIEICPGGFGGEAPGCFQRGVESGRKAPAAVGDDHLVRIVDSQSGNLLYVGSRTPIGSRLRVSPDGQVLATSGADRRIHLWTSRAKNVGATCPTVAVVYALGYSPDGRMLAAAGFDDQVAFTMRPTAGCSANRRRPARHPGPMFFARRHAVGCRGSGRVGSPLERQ